MRERKSLRWLRHDEWEWAERYLHRHHRGLRIKQIAPCYEGTVEEIEFLKRTPEGARLIERLKNALRQRRCRSPLNGKVARTFTLPNSTAMQLQYLAMHGEQTETAVVVSLINHAGEQEVRHRDQLEMMRRKQRRTALDAKTFKAALAEATKQLEKHLRELATLEARIENATPETPDDKAIKRIFAKKMRQTKEAIRNAGEQVEPLTRKHSVLEENSFLAPGLIDLSDTVNRRD